MKLFAALFVAAALVALPSSCKSTSSKDAPNLPCECGTPMGDLEGCQHPKCRDGQQNPANPKCVCGKLDIPSGK